MLNRRRLLAGAAVLAGAAAVEPARRMLGNSPAARSVTIPPAQAQSTPAPTQAQGTPVPTYTTARVPAIAADGDTFIAALSSVAAFQGGAVRVRSSVGRTGTAGLFGRMYTLLPAEGGGLEGYLSLGTGDTVGTTLVAVNVINGGFAEYAELPLYVEETDWNVEYLEIPPAPPGEADPLDPVEIQRESDLLRATYGAVTRERHWIEPWIMPMSGDITSHFGDQRSINGGPVGGHHGGTDIATPFGQTPGALIHAANHGKVVVSEKLVVRGNAVIIDHGGGVFTGYGHMLERKVEVGAFVSQGDLIGIEGATGLVTGAHLHWEVSVGGVLVDGLRWIDGSQGF